MGILLVLPTVVLGIENNPNIVAEMVGAGVTVSEKDKAQKKNLSSALQTLIHRVLKAKDMPVTDPVGAKRELESRIWFTNMKKKQVENEEESQFENEEEDNDEKKNIFGARAAGKPKSGKKKKKKTKKKAGHRRKKNRGKGKGGRSRGREKGEFGIGSVLMKYHEVFLKFRTLLMCHKLTLSLTFQAKAAEEKVIMEASVVKEEVRLLHVSYLQFLRQMFTFQFYVFDHISILF